MEVFVGVTGPDSAQLTSISTEGTMLDTDRAVWDVDDKTYSWATTEIDARRYI